MSITHTSLASDYDRSLGRTIKRPPSTLVDVINPDRMDAIVVRVDIVVIMAKVIIDWLWSIELLVDDDDLNGGLALSDDLVR